MEDIISMAIRPELRAIEEMHSSFMNNSFLENMISQWILPLPAANPAILEMFRDRDIEPNRQLLPWSGEFAGKYLTSAAQMYKLTGDLKLKSHLEWFVGELIALQDDDGYLGPWPKGYHLTGKGPKCHYIYRNGEDPAKEKLGTWDAWGHYHIMLGLILWHRIFGDTSALECAKRMGDLFCRKFLDGGERLVSTGSEEMNLAPIHSFCLLYQATGEERYLRMAREIERDFETPPAGDYIRTALEGKEFFQTPKPRWESLHAIQGIAEMYFITGDELYKKAFEHIWRSIRKTDVHNTGGFSSGEGACGNPFALGAIETCCTIAWMAMSVDMLRMTGDPTVADDLELSMLNGGMGSISPSGAWSTYNTPMDGFRWANITEIGFQARPGSPELNCCSVNAARCPGMLSEWGVMECDNGFAFNYYGPVAYDLMTEMKRPLHIELETDYPQSGRIHFRINAFRPERFTLKFRIPQWSAKTRYEINNIDAGFTAPGTYLAIDRTWSAGDSVTLELDFTLHLLTGENECAGKTSVYRGPILLAFDSSLNPDWPSDAVPEFDAAAMAGTPVRNGSRTEPDLLMEFDDRNGRKVRLCDFRSAGMTGARYRSWFVV